MPSFSSPLWLLGMGALPIIWWMHRFQHSEDIIQVSALFLWQRSPSEAATGNVRAPTDPRWILRALLFSILLLTLSHPYFTTSKSPQIVVWFDDSISMHALENGNARNVVAVDRLVDELQRESKSHVIVRSLGNHATAIDLSSVGPQDWREILFAWIKTQPPQSPLLPPRILPSGAEHWVVTDGADPEINHWLQTAPVYQVILVGKGTENAAITRLAVRRSLIASGNLHGMLTAHNMGKAQTIRTLEIHADGKLVSASSLTLTPGVDVQYDFSLQSSSDSLSARLFPADALQLDDELAIMLDDFKEITVLVRAGCGENLRAALAAHPDLIVINEVAGRNSGTTGITVDCSGTPVTTQSPTLVIHPALIFSPVTDTTRWHTGSKQQQIMLSSEWLTVADTGALPADRRLVLSAGTIPLVLASTSGGIIDVFIDMESEALVHRPVYPVLVNRLIELALERSLIDPLITVQHDFLESTIQPELKWHRPVASQFSGHYDHTNYTSQLLLLAVLILFIDILLVARTRAIRFPANWSQPVGNASKTND